MILWKKGRTQENSKALAKIVEYFTEYFNGLGTNRSNRMVRRITRTYPIVIIAGPIGIGKSILCENLSLYNRKTIYIEVNSINTLSRLIRFRAQKIIQLSEVNI